MAIDKPDLTRVWAENAPAGNVIDPNDTTPGKFGNGWQAEVPPFEHFNFLQKLFSEGLAYINEQGIPEWDASTVYPVGAIVKGSDGTIYGSIVEQNGNDPVTDDGTNWKSGASLISMEGGPSVEVAVSQNASDIAQRTEKVDANISVTVPTEYATLQEAFDYLSQFHYSSGVEAEILIESGYEIPTGPFVVQPDGAEADENVALFVKDGTYANFFIRSEDPSVTVASGFEGSVIRNYRAAGVVLDCLIDMNDEPLSNDGYTIEAGGYGRITAGSGVINAGRDNIRARQTVQLHAFNGIVATGGGRHCINVSHGACAYIRNGDYSGCKGESAVRTRGTVNLDGEGINVSGSAGHGIHCSDGGTIFVEEVNAQNCADIGIWGVTVNIDARAANMNGSNRGCFMDAGTNFNLDASTAENCTDRGYEINLGSVGSCRDASANGSDYGFDVQNASKVAASGATANNCTTNAFSADGASDIDAEGSQADNAGTYAYVANSNSRINTRDKVSASAGGSVYQCRRGSTMYKNDGNGATNTNIAINTLTADGIIFGS